MTEHGLDLVREARRQWLAHDWQGADVGMGVVISLMRAQQIVLGRLEDILRPLDLSYARYEILTLLSFTKNGELPLSKVSTRLQVHPASVSGAVTKLEDQGLVARVPHPTDGRTTLARITPAGRALATTATQTLNAGPFASPGLSDDAAEQLIALLTDLRRDAGDF